MQPLSQKQQIMKSIRRFYSYLESGDSFRTEHLVEYVKRDLDIQYIYPDSLLRYHRELKEQGKINFICTNRHDRIIEVR
jgi:hypothetical protein